MSIFQAAILGVVQGITEIFPISSSGHLILIPEILGWAPHSLSFDAALHLGTAFALLFYFGRYWISLFVEKNFRMIFFIALASVPAGLFGLFGQDFIESTLRGVKPVLYALIFVAALMLAAEYFYRRRPDHKNKAGLTDVLLIGTAQALALFPGVSRSGITILTGVSRGLERGVAAYFSFLISLPIVFAAGFYQLFDVYKQGALGAQLDVFAVGILTSFVVGFFAIKFLFALLRKFSLIPFAIYRILLGLLLLII